MMDIRQGGRGSPRGFETINQPIHRESRRGKKGGGVREELKRTREAHIADPGEGKKGGRVREDLKRLGWKDREGIERRRKGRGVRKDLKLRHEAPDDRDDGPKGRGSSRGNETPHLAAQRGSPRTGKKGGGVREELKRPDFILFHVLVEGKEGGGVREELKLCLILLDHKGRDRRKGRGSPRGFETNWQRSSASRRPWQRGWRSPRGIETACSHLGKILALVGQRGRY